MDNKIIIGVDLGGTKIMTGAIDREGSVLGFPVKIPTGGNDNAAAIPFTAGPTPTAPVSSYVDLSGNFSYRTGTSALAAATQSNGPPQPWL